MFGEGGGEREGREGCMYVHLSSSFLPCGPQFFMYATLSDLFLCWYSQEHYIHYRGLRKAKEVRDQLDVSTCTVYCIGSWIVQYLHIHQSVLYMYIALSLGLCVTTIWSFDRWYLYCILYCVPSLSQSFGQVFYLPLRLQCADVPSLSLLY